MHLLSSETITKYNYIQICFELIFVIEMILGFITIYFDKNNIPVRDVKLISMRYLKSGFLQDLIPLIPFNFMIHFRGSRYLFLLKSFRLIQAYEILDVRTFNLQIGRIFKKNLETVCNDPELGHD